MYICEFHVCLLRHTYYSIIHTYTVCTYVSSMENLEPDADTHLYVCNSIYHSLLPTATTSAQ